MFARGLFRPCHLLALLALAAVPELVAAKAAPPDPKEIGQLHAASSDPSRAASAVERLRQILVDADSAYISSIRQIMLRAQIVSGASAKEVVASADSLRPMLAQDMNTLVVVNAQVAQTLLERRDELDRAYEYAARALEACPRNFENERVYASIQSLMGEIQLLRGKTAEAAKLFEEVLPFAPDSQTVLSKLGNAYHQLGQEERAIATYIRSVAVFGVTDSSAAAPLRTLYEKRHGSLKGLAAQVEVAKHASLKAIALDARRHEGPAPSWKLPSLDGKTIESSSFEGKILVVDFWGSWCGPCRAELPFFQEMYERYKGRGVAFVGINWERGKTEQERLNAAKNFLANYSFTFPVVMDHHRTAVDAYQIEGFPTVYLIDQKGHIRYRNVGFSENIDDIMAAQIESMLQK